MFEAVSNIFWDSLRLERFFINLTTVLQFNPVSIHRKLVGYIFLFSSKKTHHLANLWQNSGHSGRLSLSMAKRAGWLQSDLWAGKISCRVPRGSTLHLILRVQSFQMQKNFWLSCKTFEKRANLRPEKIRHRLVFIESTVLSIALRCGGPWRLPFSSAGFDSHDGYFLQIYREDYRSLKH